MATPHPHPHLHPSIVRALPTRPHRCRPFRLCSDLPCRTCENWKTTVDVASNYCIDADKRLGRLKRDDPVQIRQMEGAWGERFQEHARQHGDILNRPPKLATRPEDPGPRANMIEFAVFPGLHVRLALLSWLPFRLVLLVRHQRSCLTVAVGSPRGILLPG